MRLYEIDVWDPDEQEPHERTYVRNVRQAMKEARALSKHTTKGGCVTVRRVEVARLPPLELARRCLSNRGWCTGREELREFPGRASRYEECSVCGAYGCLEHHHITKDQKGRNDEETDRRADP